MCIFESRSTPYIFFDGPLDQSEASNLSSRPIGSPDFDCSLLCAHWEVRGSAQLAFSQMPFVPTRIEMGSQGECIFGIVHDAKYADTHRIGESGEVHFWH